MSSIDTLEIYKEALDSGFSEEQALFQADLARKTSPDIDLTLIFEKINNRFDLIALEMKYMEKIGLAICITIAVNILSVWLKR